MLRLNEINDCRDKGKEVAVKCRSKERIKNSFLFISPNPIIRTDFYKYYQILKRNFFGLKSYFNRVEYVGAKETDLTGQ